MELYTSAIAKEKARIQKTVDLHTRSIEWNKKSAEWKKESRFITKAGTKALLDGGFNEGELDSLEVLTESLRRRAKNESEQKTYVQPQKQEKEKMQMVGSASMPALSDARLEALLDVERRLQMRKERMAGLVAMPGLSTSTSMANTSARVVNQAAAVNFSSSDEIDFQNSVAIASKQHPSFAESLQELSISSPLFSMSKNKGQKHPMEKLKTRNKTVSVRF